MGRLSKAGKEFRKKTGFKDSVEFARYIRESIASKRYKELVEKTSNHKKSS